MACNERVNCVPYEEYIKVKELATAYVPFQHLCGIYDPEESMVKGTIFPELASPYCQAQKNLMREDRPCCSDDNACGNNDNHNRRMRFNFFR